MAIEFFPFLRNKSGASTPRQEHFNQVQGNETETRTRSKPKSGNCYRPAGVCVDL